MISYLRENTMGGGNRELKGEGKQTGLWDPSALFCSITIKGHLWINILLGGKNNFLLITVSLKA